MTAAERSVALLLDGPLQSWGCNGRVPALRSTEMMPTLSGVTGLVANALGMERGVLDDGLLGADIWSRADRPGRRMMDFHTVGGAPGEGVPKTNTGVQSGNAILSNRWYLEDAAFTVVWQPGPGLDPETVAEAMENPARALFLGRRSCPPASDRVLLGLVDGDPEKFLEDLPLLRDPGWRAETVTAVHQSPAGKPAPGNGGCDKHAENGTCSVSAIHDVATTFHPAQRRGTYRERRVCLRSVKHPECAGRGDEGLDAILDHMARSAATK